MTETLTCSENIQRVGYTIIGDVKVVQYICLIPVDNPEAMRITSSRLNAELYKANRDICRRDLAAFEDAAYLLQEECIRKNEYEFGN